LLDLTRILLILPAIADRASEDVDLQTEVWRLLLSVRPHCPKVFTHLLELNGQLGQLCDTPAVVSTYLELLREEQPASRHRGALRLAECVRPRQLAGWAAPAPEDVLGRLEADARAPSGMEGAWSSLGLKTKQDACQTLLALGRWDAVERSALTFAGERNGFAVAETLEVAACFPLERFPPIVPDLIAGRFGELSEDRNQRLAAQVAAIHVAHSAAAPEAFRALLGYARYQLGGVLLRLIEALADCAVGQAPRKRPSATRGEAAVPPPTP
jgi:hypothetical protein